MNPPTTTKENIVENIHGREISDPYRWLEDIESAGTKSWLDEQDRYARSILDKLPRRKELRQEFEALFRKDTIGFPHPRKGRYFFMQRRADEDHAVLYVQEGLNGKPRVLVDPNKISKEKCSPVSLAGYSTSKDAKLITYNLSESSNDESALYVMDVNSGKILADRIPAELYPSSGSWSVDNSGFWYTRRKEDTPKGEEKFHRKVYYHKLGADYLNDRLIYGENLAKEDRPSASTTEDGRYLVVHTLIQSEEYKRSEIHILDLENTEEGFMPIVENVKEEASTFFFGEVHRDWFYVVTNYKAPRSKVQRVLLSEINKGMETWETVIPEHPDRTIDSISVIKDKFFVLTMENVYSVLREYSLSGEFRREINLPALGTCSSVIGEHEGDEAFFSFSSFAHPFIIFRIDFKHNDTLIFKKQKVAVDTGNIVAEQVWYHSKDGTRVPMFLVHKKGLAKTGANPTVLYGYGGFHISLTPGFMKNIIPFLERGGLYAIANLRGGDEFGEKWHKAGTKKQKQNTFDDFIAAAEWLIENKYTDSRHIVISGASNGGLLVGAAMTQRPDLFKAVVMDVPVADMLRYHLFHGGRHWIPDYGSAEDPEMFPYLLQYSPYHNVEENVEYPPTIIITADRDDRVHPGQAFKMAARLQAVNSHNPIILRVERNAGHGGGSDISRYINTETDEWGFIFWSSGIK
ncbi:MAG: S9 family peptidase [Candidatus Yanofskybacteria bacterium]|nr:S9 family peptidase [Candidatus Yanofskybacteria bacterium]